MSGERIEFPKGRPGRLVGDKILGPAATKSQKRIDKADIKKEYTVWGQPTRIVTTDGRIYELVRVLSKTKNDLVILTYDPEGTVIPLSEVRFIWIKRTDYWLSALVIIIPIAAIAAFLVWFGANWSMPTDFGGIGSAFSMPPRY